jgi:hypothetical protein
MAVNCGYSFGLCAVRVTKLDETGTVIDEPDNSYVSDKAVTINLTPNIETGNTFSLRNGCGCSLARFKSADVFNWFEFAFARGALEPELESMLLRGTPIVDGVDVVGINGPGALACDEGEQLVGLEFWSQHNLGSGQDALHPWVHWVFPATVWQIGDNTAEEDIMQMNLNGFSRTSGGWGSGPYGDGPPDGQDITEWAYWKTDVDPPTAACNAVDVEPGS